MFKDNLANHRAEHPDEPIDPPTLLTLAIGPADEAGSAARAVATALDGAYDPLFATRSNKTIQRELALSNLISSTESAVALRAKLAGGYYAFEGALLENIDDPMKLSKTFKKALDRALPFDPDTKLVEKSATIAPRLPLKVYYMKERKM